MFQKTLFNYVQAGIVVIDALTHIIVEANPAACIILGANTDDIVGSKCSSWLCHPNEQYPIIGLYNVETIIENKESIITRRDGSVRYVLRNVACFPWKGRTHIIESLVDITYQKETEHSYKLLEENAPVGLYEIDFKSGKFTKVNELMCKYTGYACDELLEMSVFDLLDDDSCKIFKERLLKLGEKEYVDPNIEYKIKTKDGDFVWVLVTVQFKYKDGLAVGASAVAQNISKMKEIEMKLRENEKKLKEERDRAQLYLDLAANIFIALDVRGMITLINREGCNILGVEECTLISQSWFDTYVRPDYKDFAMAKFEELIHNGESISIYDYPIVRSDGESVWIHWQSKTIKNALGEVVSIFSSGDDITDKRKMDNELKKLWSEGLIGLQVHNTGIADKSTLVDNNVMVKLRTAIKSIE